MSNKRAGSFFITEQSFPWMPWCNISDEDNEELVEDITEEVEGKQKDDFKEEKFALSQFEKEEVFLFFVLYDTIFILI